MVDITTGDTPLELARKAKEEETRLLMGFGDTKESKAELTQMQEIQNVFNAYKTTGATLLQQGKITSEQYYTNTRQAGIKLGIIGADEYPDNLPTWLKPTLEIGGAVIGGIVPYLGAPGRGIKLAAESVGSGIGAGTGTAIYGVIQDLAAPEGMPTASFAEVTKEAATDGAIVTGLTAGVLKSLPAIGQLASGAAKISPKATENLKRVGKAGRDAIVNNPQFIKMKSFASGYMIQEQRIANELLQELRNNGIEPSYNMLISNETVRSLVQALARTPILGKPERESYELIKKDIFKRITEGVKPGANTTIDESLAAFSNNFIIKNGEAQLKKGIKDKSLRELSLIGGFIREQRLRDKNQTLKYEDMKNALLKDADFKKGKAPMTGTKEWWDNIDNIAGDRLALKDQKLPSEILKDTNVGLYFNLMYRPDRLPDKKVIEGLFDQNRAKEILKTLDDPTLVQFELKQAGKNVTYNIPRQFMDVQYKPIKELTPLKQDRFNKFLRQIEEGASEADAFKAINVTKDSQVKEFTKDFTRTFRFKNPQGKTSTINANKIRKYDINNLRKAAEGVPLKAGATKREILDAKVVPAVGVQFLNKSPAEQMLIAQKSLIDDLNTFKYFEKSNGDNLQFKVLGDKFNQGRLAMSEDIKTASGNRLNALIDDANATFVENRNLLDRSGPLLQGFRVASTGSQKEALLKYDNIFGGKLKKLDEGGGVIPNNYLTDAGKKRKDGSVYYTVTKNSDGDPVLLTPEQQLKIPGMSQGEMYARGSMKEGQVPDADIIKKMYIEGNKDSIEAFRKLVGKSTFRKFAQDEIDSALNGSLIKYINGKTDDGIADFWKSFAIGTDKAFTNREQVKQRVQTLIKEADFKFTYDEIEAFGHMLRYLNGAPALNQFIQRSMMLRFSQGIGPGAIGGLLGGTGLAAGGAVGALAGLGGMYVFNMMMASRVAGKEVKGAIKNYIKAVTAGKTDEAKALADSVLQRAQILNTPFFRQMREISEEMGLRQITTQGAINLGVTSNLEE